MICWFKQHGAPGPCEGRIDRCHFIAQRVLKREHQRANPRSPAAWFMPSALTGIDLRKLLGDPRNWRPGCRRHHHRADHFIDPYQLPASAREFAAEFELDHWLPVVTEQAA